jgi:lambda repressor-like predicted transcriptional regulator
LRKNEIRAARIYYWLRLKGTSAAEIGRGLGVTRRMVSYVILGVRRTEHIRQAVAAALGMDYQKVWGEAPAESPRRRASAGG